MTGPDQPKSTPQQDLLALLSNPEVMRMLAFGARTMTRVVDTGREISKVAAVMNPGFPGFPSPPASTPPTEPASEPAPETQPAAGSTGYSVPDGSLLVPIEAWNRVLDQLGNLHEAGQALAEARERAAKAEAVADFQAERRTIAEAEISRLAAELEAEKAPPPEPVTESAAPAITGRGVGRAVRAWWRG